MDNQQTNPLAPKGTASQNIDLSEKDIANIGTETIKYSIRTMAQDLERAKKEGLSSAAAGIKTPTPPPPPPKIIPPKPAPSAMPIAPKSTTIAPPTIKQPIAEIPLKVPAIPTPEIPPLKKGLVSAPTPPQMIPTPTIKREIPPPPGLPIAPKPSITAAIPSAAIPTPAPTIKQPIAPIQKKLSFISFPQLKLVLGIIAVVIVLFSSIGFSYWWFFIKQVPVQPQPTEELPPVITEPNLPEKISQSDRDLIIETSIKTPSTEITSLLMTQISSSAEQLSDKQLGRILIKYSSDTEKSYLSFIESLTLLQITIPENISSSIRGGELLTYNQGGQLRYGFATTISSTLSMLDAMKGWEKTILDDVNNLYIDSSPIKPQDTSFQDDYQDNFIIRYLNLPTSTLSIAWAESNEKQMFIVATSKDMTYKIIGAKEIAKPMLKTYPSGTLVKAKNDTKIYRIIDDKKLWIPTIKAFLDSGYKPNSQIEIIPEELDNLKDVKYVKMSIDKDIYELRDGKRYLVSDTASLPQQEIKIVTPAELNAYPLGK